MGCHHWLPKYNSDEIQKEIFNPIEDIYICGEGFSNKQAWIEGSLTSCLKVIKSLSMWFKNFYDSNHSKK